MPEWILRGMPSAIVLIIFARLILINRRRFKPRKPMAKGKEVENVIFEQLTFEQLRKYRSRDRIDFETSSGEVLRIADSTPVTGFSASIPKPHIPRGSQSVTMCRGISVIVSLSDDARILMLQRKGVDGRYLLYFLEATSDRRLEESYLILSALFTEEPAAFRHRKHRRSLIGGVAKVKLLL